MKMYVYMNSQKTIFRCEFSYSHGIWRMEKALSDVDLLSFPDWKKKLNLNFRVYIKFLFSLSPCEKEKVFIRRSLQDYFSTIFGTRKDMCESEKGKEAFDMDWD